VAIEVLVLVAVASGLTSWAVGVSWGRWVTVVHGVAGLSLLVLAPAKARGSVRTGMRRGRHTRWLSLALAALVLTTIVLGFVHATGLAHGVGYWSPLWTHFLAALIVLAVFTWHVFSRPARPGIADLDRRAFIRGGAVVAVGAAAYATQEVVVRALGLDGGDRRFTGSHEVGSLAPADMPTVSWINDEAPDATGWRLEIAGAPTDLDDLRRRAFPVEATLDCTGGWWSTQRWDAVPVADLLRGQSARSIKVSSATGYSRLFPFSDADRLYLAVGYGGEPLRRGHGAPVRLVAPGRRGPWWVKWVSSVALDDRPWWLQLPFPLE
jgi:Oxidoreductase molybdopterin binding domain